MDQQSFQTVMAQFMSLFSSGALVVFLLQWVKKSKYAPFITAETAKLNRAVAWLAAGGAAIGIRATFDPQAHSLLITGLSLGAVWHGAAQWMHSIVMQEVLYAGVQIKDKLTAMGAPVQALAQAAVAAPNVVQPAAAPKS